MSCRTRLYSSGAPAEMVGELCPSCGGLLEPVDSLAEIVGFRHITRRPDTADTDFAEAVAAALPRPPTAR